jgi:plastocyanin
MKTLIYSRIRYIMIASFLFVILSITSSCSKSTSDGTGGPGNNEVWIQNMSFNPSTINITAGTTITWTNKDGVNHTITSNTGIFDSGSIATNGTYSHLFGSAGTFPYHCTIHPSMTATVVVN